MLFISGTAVAQQTNPTSSATNNAAFANLKHRAEQGDAGAEYQLGLKYAYGAGVTTNYPEAFKWWLKSGEDGNSNSWVVLGAVYYKGNSACNVKPNRLEAIKWFRKAADNGNVAGEDELGEIYYSGDGVAEDDVSALSWFQRAAEQNDSYAEFYLGWMYNNGKGVGQDYAVALDWYQKSANQGNAASQNNLGQMYETGQGVDQDDVEAYKWYNLSAAQGLKNAVQNRDRLAGSMMPSQIAHAQKMSLDFKPAVGFVPDETNSTVVDPNAKAVAELRNRAEHGDAQAELVLGFSYSTGDDVPKDGDEAFKWWLRSAEDGNTNIYGFIATLYYDPNPFCDVPTNHAEAAEWFRKAAAQGDTRAQYTIAGMYRDGDGVLQDYVLALDWYRRAANQGDAESQNGLGTMCEAGQGVPQNYIEAYKWYNLSAAQGDTNAIQNRQRLAYFMTPSQIAQAQEMSRDYAPTIGSIPEQSNSLSPDAPKVAGTGFFITTDGYLISSFHVVKNARHVRIATAAGLIPAKSVQADEANDLVLLKVKGKFSALSVVASRTVGLGDTVFSLGFPDPELQGSSPKLAKGEIASLSGPEDDARYFQISAPVQPGNSGGALVNERGNVVGIVAAKLDAATALTVSGALPENVNYAIKSSYLLSFLESVPEIAAKLKSPNTLDEKFSDAVKDAEKATVMVLVY
jgi:hypothetical protein